MKTLVEQVRLLLTEMCPSDYLHYLSPPLNTAPGLGEQSTSNPSISHAAEIVPESLTKEVEELHRQYQKSLSEAQIREQKDQCFMATWRAKYKSLPELTNEESVLKLWKKCIMELLKHQYPGDWQKVDWPTPVKRRMDPYPEMKDSKSIIRKAKQSVSYVIGKGLESLAKKHPSAGTDQPSAQ